MQALVIIALFLVGTCHCGVEYLKPYNETAAMIFQFEDRDGNGFMSLTETESWFTQYDKNGNGLVSRHEYTEFTCEQMPFAYNLAHYLYDVYDVNHDHQLEMVDYDHFHGLMDADHDGLVSQAEFITYWEKLFASVEGADTHGQTHLHGASACH